MNWMEIFNYVYREIDYRIKTVTSFRRDEVEC